MNYDINELHRVQFGLLKEFVRICNELDLRYYLVGGSALGAVKYKGFVPWDDDVDVALPRRDYEVFLKEAQSRLPDNIFLQNYRMDPEFPMLFSKLRNSDTACIEKSWRKMHINHGIYIDVFPLDGYPKSFFSRFALNVRIAWYKTLLAFARNKIREAPTLRNKVESAGYRLFGKHLSTAKIFSRYEKAIMKYSADTSEFLYNYGNKLHGKEKVPAAYYGDGAEAEFEGLKVIIPSDSDAFLRHRFGDYLADLPEEQRLPSHLFEIVDTECSYLQRL